MLRTKTTLLYIFLWAMVMGSIFNALSNATRVCTNNVGCICRYTCALGRAQVDANRSSVAAEAKQINLLLKRISWELANYIRRSGEEEASNGFCKCRLLGECMY